MKKEREIKQYAGHSKYEILLETLKIGSISKAAEQLNYTQSGLTYLLNTIEMDLGITILKRDYRGIQLTEAGRKLEPYLQQLVGMENELRVKVDEIAAVSTGELRISTIQSFAKYHLPQVIAQFQQAYPGVVIEIDVVGGAKVSQAVGSRHAELGFLDIINCGDLECMPLFDEQMYIAVPSAWEVEVNRGAVTLDSLQDCPIIHFFSNSNNIASMVAKEKGPRGGIRVTMDGGTILEMVRRGLGFAILSEKFCMDIPTGVRMYPMDPPVFRTIGMVSRSVDGLKTIAKRFAAMVTPENRLAGQRSRQ